MNSNPTIMFSLKTTSWTRTHSTSNSTAIFPVPMLQSLAPQKIHLQHKCFVLFCHGGNKSAVSTYPLHDTRAGCKAQSHEQKISQ
jgi:hypothetical protein